MPRALKDYAILTAAVFAGWFALARLFPGAPDLPDLAPPLALRDPQGGFHSLEALRGRVVVLNFWASWCGPCVQEIPEFSAFSRDHPEVTVLGVAVDSGGAAEVGAVAARLGIPYTVLVADPGVGRTWDISTLPTTVFIGTDGHVLGAHVGAMDRAGIEAALARDTQPAS